jgi:hypothetical protein
MEQRSGVFWSGQAIEPMESRVRLKGCSPLRLTRAGHGVAWDLPCCFCLLVLEVVSNSIRCVCGRMVMVGKSAVEASKLVV